MSEPLRSKWYVGLYGFAPLKYWDFKFFYTWIICSPMVNAYWQTVEKQSAL